MIYLSSFSFRQSSFYERLNDKAVTVANLYFQYSKLDSGLLREIDRVTQDHPYGENVSIFDEKENKIYTNNDTLTIPVSSAQFAQIHRQRKYDFSWGEFEVTGILYKFGDIDYVIVSGAIDKFGLSKLDNLRNTLLIVFFFIIVMVVGVGRLYSARALKPISKVIDEAEIISPENLASRIENPNSRDEIGRLINTFNKLLDRIENAFKLQKTFVASASHEIKNPLTVITSQLEVTLLKERSNEEYRSTILSVLEDIKDLNKLAFQLMDLARATNAGTDILSQEVRMDELLFGTKEYFLEKFPEYKVNIFIDQLPDRVEQLSLRGNEQLLKIAILNLAENACKFSDDHSVDLHFTGHDDYLEILVRDRGQGIAENEHSLIFEPFYRSAKDINRKGHGVGLALVNQIVKIHQGTISVHSIPGEGTTFRMVYKL